MEERKLTLLLILVPFQEVVVDVIVDVVVDILVVVVVDVLVDVVIYVVVDVLVDVVVDVLAVYTHVKDSFIKQRKCLLKTLFHNH